MNPATCKLIVVICAPALLGSCARSGFERIAGDAPQTDGGVVDSALNDSSTIDRPLIDSSTADMEFSDIASDSSTIDRPLIDSSTADMEFSDIASGDSYTSDGAIDSGVDASRHWDFVDDEEVEFALGDHNQTRWNSTGVTLTSTMQIGTFTSRVFDTNEPGANWSPFRWDPAAPYGKEQPGNGDETNVYLFDGLDSVGLAGLWHLNGTLGAASNNSSVSDSSVHNAHGVLNDGGTTSLEYQSGKLQQALWLDGVDDWVEIPSPAGGTLDIMSGSITLSAWVKPEQNLVDSQAIVGKDDWAQNCTGTTVALRNYQLFFRFNGALAFGFNPGTTLVEAHNYLSDQAVYTTGTWKHVATTFTFGDGSSAHLYLDGVELPGSWFSGDGNDVPNRSNAVPLQIGANSCGSEQRFPGLVDEVSVWTRALSSTEVRSLYRRGALRLKFQVRTCAVADCASAEFVGVDGTTASFFEERWNPQNALPNFVPSNLAPNRFFQYQTIFESDTSAVSPEVLLVGVEAWFPSLR